MGKLGMAGAPYHVESALKIVDAYLEKEHPPPCVPTENGLAACQRLSPQKSHREGNIHPQGADFQLGELDSSLTHVARGRSCIPLCAGCLTIGMIDEAFEDPLGEDMDDENHDPET